MTENTPILPAPLRRNIIVLLALKGAALALIYWLCFGQPASSDAAAVSDHLLALRSPQQVEQ